MSYIDLVTQLSESAVSETNRRISPNTASGIYFTVDRDNKIREHDFIASTLFDGNQLTICGLTYTYQSFGFHKIYEVFCFVRPNGSVITEVVLNHWMIKRIEFKSSSPTGKPKPKVTFALKNTPEESFLFDTSSVDNIQLVWDFFLQIDEKCRTAAEAVFYMEFFIKRLENQIQSATIEEYKRELSTANDLLNQHKQLINKLESILQQA